MGYHRQPERAHAEAVEHAERARVGLAQAAALADDLSIQLADVQNLLSPLGLNVPDASDGDRKEAPAMTGPPAREEMFDNAVALLDQAYQALGDAADWLRSGWTPVGSALTEEQAGRRTRMFDEIDKAKQAINRAKH
jgi:hypothetical protein